MTNHTITKAWTLTPDAKPVTFAPGSPFTAQPNDDGTIEVTFTYFDGGDQPRTFQAAVSNEDFLAHTDTTVPNS